MATTLSRVERPGGDSERVTDALGDVGPTSLGVSVGIQLLFAGLLFVPLPGLPAVTNVGAFYVRPEWDGLLFILGGTVGTLLATAFCLLRGRARRLPRVGTAAQVAVAVAGVVISLAVLRYGRRHLLADETVPAPYLLACLGAIAATAAAGLLGRRTPVATTAGPLSRPVTMAPASPVSAALRRKTGWAIDVLVLVAIVAVIYQPGSRLLSGQTFQVEALLHWDFFAMGPTLAYDAGAALGTDVHVFYGVGWPVLFSVLSPVLPISYAHMIEVVQIDVCLYLMGVYLFLFLFGRDRIWAATGVVLVLVFHFFARSAGLPPYWGYPSLTLVRFTIDVWFFSALVLSLSSPGRPWDVVAGALVGVAILFQLDTGFYLAAAMGFFWLCRGAASPDRRATGRRAALATAAGASVLLVGLAVASRGTLVHAGFWSGWLENLRTTASGLSMEPIATSAPLWTVGALVLMMAVYLSVVSHCVVGAIRGRISADTAVLGPLAAYGFLVTLYYVGRSTPYNLVRSSAPFALLLAALGARGFYLLAARLRARSEAGDDRRQSLRNRLSSGWIVRGPAVIALAVSLVLLVQNPVFRGYRGLARTALGSHQPDGVCVLDHPKDLCGPGVGAFPEANGVRHVVERLDQLAPDGEEVAVLDQTGPAFLLGSGTAPWGRYSPLLLSLFFPQRLESVIENFTSDPPRVVVIRSANADLFRDTVTPLRELVRDRYEMDSEVAGFQIWLLRTSG